MNRNEYDAASYTGSSYKHHLARSPYHPASAQPQHPYHRSVSSRNDYDVDSLVSGRGLPSSRDYGQHGWERRSHVDGPYGRRGSDSSRLRSQYTRLDSSSFRDHHFRPHQPAPHHTYDPQLDASPPRREYSPLRKVSKGLDGVFKGFTTPLPGNDPGYASDTADLMEHGSSVRTPSSRRYSDVDRASAYRGLSSAGSISTPIGGSTTLVPPGAATAASGGMGSGLYGNDPRFRYGGAGGMDGRPHYGGAGAGNASYLMDDYQPEPTHRYLHDGGGSAYNAPPSRYGATPSIASFGAGGRRPVGADCYGGWAATTATPPPPLTSTPCWDSAEAEQTSPRMGEHPLSPRTFKRECQRAFKEARAQRMRNLEEGLYGKCDWATFDAKYC